MAGRKIFLVMDGASDDPIPELGGRTPLEAAVTPNLDRLVVQGEVGLAATVPEGLTPGSDVANLMLLGYDPRVVLTGRGPLEAAAMGIELEEGEIAFRINTISITDDGLMKDYSAGHITTAEAAEIIESMKPVVERNGGRLYPGVQYRHLMRRWDEFESRTFPPHDNIGVPIVELKPGGALGRIVDETRAVLRDHPVNVARRARGKNTVDALWPWGQGRSVKLPTIQERFGARGSLVSAVDLVRGIGVLAGFRIMQVPGITGYYDTNYAGKAEHAIAALAAGDDVAVIHVESPDEAGHEHEIEEKVRAIENIDREIVGRLVAQVPDLAILCVPDHPTYLATGKHGAAPVPFLLSDTRNPRSGPATFCEKTASGTPVPGGEPFRRLMEL